MITIEDKIGVLSQSRDLIAAGWCVNSFCETRTTKTGIIGFRKIEQHNDFCARGALQEVLGLDHYEESYRIEMPYLKELERNIPHAFRRQKFVKNNEGEFDLAGKMYGRPISWSKIQIKDRVPIFNDLSTHDEIVALFDRTIAALKSDRGVAQLKLIKPAEGEEKRKLMIVND